MQRDGDHGPGHCSPSACERHLRSLPFDASVQQALDALVRWCDGLCSAPPHTEFSHDHLAPQPARLRRGAGRRLCRAAGGAAAAHPSHQRQCAVDARRGHGRRAVVAGPCIGHVRMSDRDRKRHGAGDDHSSVRSRLSSGARSTPGVPARENGSASFEANPLTHFLAEWTGLEPATPGVTGRYSNQLNYHSSSLLCFLHHGPHCARVVGVP